MLWIDIAKSMPDVRFLASGSVVSSVTVHLHVQVARMSTESGYRGTTTAGALTVFVRFAV